ncbi:hypothetical protein AVEN_273807-1 [Araneus ventricosus]|uniref:Uncharacterized protein n=1 Tax=Araneus ventricosus TaxID=182803 RepID=A0A4Y2F5G0_ARAVE|nr:hypothetical protein AVEN_273807-1 [Araneus ventricosus]
MYPLQTLRKTAKRNPGSGGIRTHAPEETGALNQRLRPLGHATTTFISQHSNTLLDFNANYIWQCDKTNRVVKHSVKVIDTRTEKVCDEFFRLSMKKMISSINECNLAISFFRTELELLSSRYRWCIVPGEGLATSVITDDQITEILYAFTINNVEIYMLYLLVNFYETCY